MDRASERAGCGGQLKDSGGEGPGGAPMRKKPARDWVANAGDTGGAERLLIANQCPRRDMWVGRRGDLRQRDGAAAQDYAVGGQEQGNAKLEEGGKSTKGTPRSFAGWAEWLTVELRAGRAKVDANWQMGKQQIEEVSVRLARQPENVATRKDVGQDATSEWREDQEGTDGDEQIQVGESGVVERDGALAGSSKAE
ncbi:hypothetical protein PWT90_10730 [Aphanocladium album]|nr:hypothetical protein PWT90_10730 [Aphanocladium album]